MAGVAKGAERDKPDGCEDELENCGTGTGEEVAAAAANAGVDLVPRRCLARRPDGFCRAGVGVAGGADSDSVGDGVWRARDALRRGLAALTAGDAAGVGYAFSALFGRRPRGLEGVLCSSSSEVARE